MKINFEPICEHKKKLREKGAILIQDFVNADLVEKIEHEVAPWLQNINLNEISGCTVFGSTVWLHHLGLSSPTAIKVALDEKILNFMEDIFGEPAILAEVSYQKKIGREPTLKMHTDGDGGILIFIYLSEVNIKNGATTCLLGTHHHIEKNRFRFIEDNEYAEKNLERLSVEGSPGLALIFHQDIWHYLPEITEPGRRVMWFLYQPQSRPGSAVDHVYRQNYLNGLSERQLKAYGVGMPPFGRQGLFRFTGVPFKLSALKSYIKFLINSRFNRKQ